MKGNEKTYFLKFNENNPAEKKIVDYIEQRDRNAYPSYKDLFMTSVDSLCNTEKVTLQNIESLFQKYKIVTHVKHGNSKMLP